MCAPALKLVVAEVARREYMSRVPTCQNRVGGVVQTPCHTASCPRCRDVGVLWRRTSAKVTPYSPSDWSRLPLALAPALPRVWITPKRCHHILGLRPWFLCHKCPGIPDSIINIAMPTFWSFYSDSHKDPFFSQAALVRIFSPLQGRMPRVDTTCIGRVRDDRTTPVFVGVTSQGVWCMFWPSIFVHGSFPASSTRQCAVCPLACAGSLLHSVRGTS